MEELEIKLDFRSKKPLSEQLQDGLRHLITENALPSGEQLPAVRQLAARLQVNFNTVARAYRTLDQEGLISTQQGRGTYILAQGLHPEAALLPGKSPLALEEKSQTDAINQLVNNLLIAAGQKNISIQEIYQAISQRLEKNLQTEKISKKHPVRMKMNKRRYHPNWDILSLSHERSPRIHSHKASRIRRIRHARNSMDCFT